MHGKNGDPITILQKISLSWLQSELHINKLKIQFILVLTKQIIVLTLAIYCLLLS